MTEDKKKSKEASEGAIDHDMIRHLAGLLDETDLTEIEIENAEIRVRVARQIGVTATQAVVASAAPAASGAASEAAPAAAAGDDFSTHPGAVASPMVGTAYLSPQPDTPNFIAEGDTVTEGQTLLIIEAMKTMNAIPAPKAGKVTKILVGNEDPVEFGEPLVIIE